ncbi:nuclear pore complex protein Nup98-Nup96-like isoform X1 [Acanthaster planci]|uniref:Nuclear pore complex protein Nup98-Nup96 n=1 Tax=Acanthaster planci TaxID=133434 RepID=A0A8B7Z2H2_ACAPL|nr:nuclear pore complex protein Nup98-Nup96-like isoform X1 [Acanthaster planci]XP_022098971.1 nuclear pore complex protein Nup98-Nup96-like isoform X1 [Acanthaster planci]XP_022098972.1 nuclear pore complex protein Nup98-Nup96-like isoform X1 [Acanthaster planci]XP_022098974.1 nuclear pore complex protein Nup98-Nup96-like isoform X1 [Acanthaster planci]XP_022098975.1 nuclear pore complex protein Nup98-Nup96-like isoform X1 [Acanthaster planci]
MNKSVFATGTTPFGVTASTGLFGQTLTSTTPFGQTAAAGTSSGLFGAWTGGLFGGTAQNGTTVKFNPVTSTDTMVKSGMSTNINTKHQVITAMKEYVNKSFEELRAEDYIANRKGSTCSTLLGQGLTQVDNKAGGLFGQSTTSSGGGFTFGQNNPTFGTGMQCFAAGFGTSSGGLFSGQQTHQSGGLFGQKTGFGATGSTGFDYGEKSTSAFGQTASKEAQPSARISFSQLATLSSEPVDDDDKLIRELEQKQAKLEKAIRIRQLQDEICLLEAKLSEMNTEDSK